MPHTQPSHTISNIDFSQFQEHQEDPQKDLIFQRKTKVPHHFRTVPEQPCLPKEQLLLKNRVYGSEKKIEVPQREVYVKKKEDNLGFKEFLEKHRTFVKPYGQNAKYVDLLNRNHILIRRGPFQSPVLGCQPVRPRTRGTRFRMTRVARQSNNSKTQASAESEAKLTIFDKTVSTQASIYKGLMNRERNNKSEQILLHNSVNRLLAAERLGHEYPSAFRHRTAGH